MHIVSAISNQHLVLYSFQNPFHLRMDMRTSVDSLMEILNSVLQNNSWEELAVITCHPWESTIILDYVTANTSIETHEILNIHSLDDADVGTYLNRHFNTIKNPQIPLLLHGCDAQRSSLVFQAAKDYGLEPLEFHWLVGQPLNVEEMQTDGLPPGLLAYGEVSRPSLETFLRDAVDLVTKAISSAVQVRPDLALIQTMINCNDKQTSQNESSGLYLSR